MSDVIPIIVPQLNPNDETIRLVEWLVAHCQIVSAGESICEVETSKAVTEIVAEQPGVNMDRLGLDLASDVEIAASFVFMGNIEAVPAMTQP